MTPPSPPVTPAHPAAPAPPATPALTGEPDVPWRTHPALRPYVAAGLLTSADVRVAERVAALTGDDDPHVLLATALTVQAVRSGSTCLVLAEAAEVAVGGIDPDAPDGSDAQEIGSVPDDATSPAPAVAPPPLPWPEPAAWEGALRASPAVAVGGPGPVDEPLRPLVLSEGRVYLDRYARDERLVHDAVLDRLTQPPLPPVDPEVAAAAAARAFARVGDEQQRAATATVFASRLTVLTGGPGTGKTTTVEKLLEALESVLGPDLRIALAAPTGKAAARLEEAVGRPASTIHRLLGWLPASSTRFRHDAAHHLPHDVVVVDEASMVSLPLLARVLEAVRPDARLVLVGDPDQLASVEVGAVLGDLVRPPAGHLSPVRPGFVTLVEEHRYGVELSRLAAAIRRGDADAVLAELRAGNGVVELVEPADPEHPLRDETGLAGLRGDVGQAGAALFAAADAGDANGALDALGRHRLLLAHRRGPAGVAQWAPAAQAWVEQATGRREDGPWAIGRPLIVTANDRTTGLYNGDTGVVVAGPGGGVAVAFGTPEAPRLVRPHRLPAVEPVHAMTIHRSQGSQFERVSVVLPTAGSPLLTRELLYTAVTRAQEHVRVVGTPDAVRVAVGRRVRRASGLQLPL